MVSKLKLLNGLQIFVLNYAVLRNSRQVVYNWKLGKVQNKATFKTTLINNSRSLSSRILIITVQIMANGLNVSTHLIIYFLINPNNVFSWNSPGILALHSTKKLFYNKYLKFEKRNTFHFTPHWKYWKRKIFRFN